MTEKTKELLLKCANVGYDTVGVCVIDKRMPSTAKYGPGDWAGGLGRVPIKIISGSPPQAGKSPRYPGGDGWPKMWDIVRDCGLTAGLKFGGLGLGDMINISQIFCNENDLTAGLYKYNKTTCRWAMV